MFEMKTVRKKRLVSVIWEQRSVWFMMLPFLSIYMFTTFIPAVASILLSFCNYNMFQKPIFAGFNNYINLFLNDSIFVKALSNTILFAVITGPLAFFLSFVVAWFINDLPNEKLRAFITLIFYAPSISGASTIIFKLLFSSDSNGYLNAFLLNNGMISEPILWFQDSSLALWMVMLVQLWGSLGVGFLSFIAGLQNVDRSLYESGSIDGIRNRWQELWYITLPCMRPMLLFGAITQIAASFSCGTLSAELCGNPSVDYSAHTLLLHALDYQSNRLEMGYAAAISVVLFVMITFAYKFCNLLLSRIGK